MIADFDRQADDLDRDIRVEEDRVSNHDPAHFAYPTLAKATIQRRDNLRRSSSELNDKLDAAMKALSEAELEAAQLLKQNERIEEPGRFLGSVDRLATAQTKYSPEADTAQARSAAASNLDSHQHYTAQV